MVGMDASGMAAMLYSMQMGEVVTTVRPISFNVEAASNPKAHFTAWDVGGNDEIRLLYKDCGV